MMAGTAVSWCSRLQKIVTLLSTEAEDVSLSTVVKEAVRLGRLIASLKNELELCKEQMVIYADNKGSMHLEMNGTSKLRTKHIDVR